MSTSHKDIIILGIESSCDDTSAAILQNGNILANIIAGQQVHVDYGGVVPELASRAHQQNIIPVVDKALKEAGVSKEELTAIAFTRGPGLLGSLLVGTSFAKSLALALQLPMVEVNHMQAHVLAHFIKEKDGSGTSPGFPFICLTVSGGHTQIVLVRDYLDMEVVGETIDDAAGEAFDKVAKIMGFPYPGGPLVDRHAKEGNPTAFSFTHPKVDGYNYSFSGLKTGFLYFLRKEVQANANFVEEHKNDICASIQHTIVSILLRKLERAMQDFGVTEVAIAGGVSANSGLREAITALGQQKGWKVHIPKFEYCTDNAAMIAITGHYKFLQHDFAEQDLVPMARMKI